MISPLRVLTETEDKVLKQVVYMLSIYNST